MKLILENWRNLVEQEEQQTVSTDAASAQINPETELSNTFNSVSYTDFVTKLSKIASDPKVKAVLSAGITDGSPEDEQVKIVKRSIKVKDLRPTQNEVDLEKSLKFPLTVPEAFLKCFQPEIVINNTPIITAEDMYVLDGHHRWSQVYSINPEAEMTAYDLSFPSIKKPLDYLKIVQAAIAADIGKVPVQNVKGQNLFTINLDDSFKQWILKTITPAVDFFTNPDNKIPELLKIKGQMTDISSAAEGLYKAISRNISLMRETSQPVEGAPGRGYMPQTDDAKNWIELTSKGSVNFINPKVKDAAGVTAESIRRMIRKTIREQLETSRKSRK